MGADDELVAVGSDAGHVLIFSASTGEVSVPLAIPSVTCNGTHHAFYILLTPLACMASIAALQNLCQRP